MIIAISGTPGTGKTKLAQNLAEKLHARLLTINGVIKKAKIPYSMDKKRNTKVIDITLLKKGIKELITKKDTVIEGHLSHFIKCDYVFVLRTDPEELEKRLKRRKWSKEKIRENVQAEILDEITIEALQNNKNVFELDTTGKSAEQATNLIVKILKNPSAYRNYLPGRVDWTNKYIKKLVGE